MASVEIVAQFLAPASARRSRLAGHGSPVTARRSRLAALAASGAAEDFTNFQVSFGGHPLPPATPRFLKAAVPFRPATVHLPKVIGYGRKVAVRGGKVTAHGRKVAVHLPIVAVTFRPGTATFLPFSAKNRIFCQKPPVFRQIRRFHRFPAPSTRPSPPKVEKVAGGRMRGILHPPSAILAPI